MHLYKENKKDIIFIVLLIISLIIMIFIPSGFEKQQYINTEGVKVKVLSVDNSNVINTGLFKQGDQTVEIEILTGSFKGDIKQANNMLSGSLAEDKLFEEKDIAWALVGFDENKEINFANMVDHYRIDKQIVLVLFFSVLITLFSGITGLRTILSFSFTLVTIWKVLIPLMLKGYNPMIVAIVIGNILAVITIILVSGFKKMSYAAIISTISCSFATCFLAVIFGNYFNIHGAVMDLSESLLYAGYLNLDLTMIFQAGIYLASSGAVLDLAVDISSALDEVVINSPDITSSKLIKSGLNIGKSIVGSQTTTLLFAYMGSYLSVMMVYMAQGTPLLNILNSKVISAEILHTFIGCIGLVLVSPLTSLTCGIILRKD